MDNVKLTTKETISLLNRNKHQGENRMSFIIYDKESNFVFNRSVDILNNYILTIKCALETSKEFVLKLANKYVPSLDLDNINLDFSVGSKFRILDIINVNNYNNKDQKLLNDIKNSWANKLKANIKNNETVTVDMQVPFEVKKLAQLIAWYNYLGELLFNFNKRNVKEINSFAQIEIYTRRTKGPKKGRKNIFNEDDLFYEKSWDNFLKYLKEYLKGNKEPFAIPHLINAKDFLSTTQIKPVQSPLEFDCKVKIVPKPIYTCTDFNSCWIQPRKLYSAFKILKYKLIHTELKLF